MKKLALLALLIASPAVANDIDDVKALHEQIQQVRGIQVKVGGVDTNEALKKISAAIMELDRRLQELEKKK